MAAGPRVQALPVAQHLAKQVGPSPAQAWIGDQCFGAGEDRTRQHGFAARA